MLGGFFAEKRTINMFPFIVPNLTCCLYWQAKRDLNDPENAIIGAFAGK